MLWQIIQLVKSWCIASFQHGSVSHWMFHCSLVCIVTVSQISHCAAFPISLAEWCRLSLVCKFLHDLNRYLLDLKNQHFNLVYVFGLGILDWVGISLQTSREWSRVKAPWIRPLGENYEIYTWKVWSMSSCCSSERGWCQVVAVEVKGVLSSTCICPPHAF